MSELKRYNDTLLAFTAFALAAGLTGCATHHQESFPKVPLQRLEKNVQIDKNAVQQAEEPTLSPFSEVQWLYPQPAGCYRAPCVMRHDDARRAFRAYRHCRER